MIHQLHQWFISAPFFTLSRIWTISCECKAGTSSFHAKIILFLENYISHIIGHFVLMISLDLMKSSEVRKAGDRSICYKDSIILNNYLILHFFFKTKWFPFEHTLMQFSASLLNCFYVCILEHFKVYIVCISILWPCAISSSKWALVIMTWCWIFM